MTTLTMPPAVEIDPMTARTKMTWTTGDFGKIAKGYEPGAAEFIERLNFKRNDKVLDVACGTGNLAIPAARKGASVTGIDIAPNLVEQAKAWAQAEKLNVQFEEGDAEQMPYANGSFDAVVTMFGAMFAPRPEKTASELARVCRSGGRIAMANWTPDGFIGQMFKIMGKHVPPAQGIPSPILWGKAEAVKDRFGDQVADVRYTERTITFNYPFDAAATVEYFRAWYGPTQRAFATLGPEAQQALRSDLEALWSAHNRSNNGATQVDSTYLEVVAVRK
ncbi:MAG: class I SAM-dependent methyltransferase [Caldilineaceae bacterium]